MLAKTSDGGDSAMTMRTRPMGGGRGAGAGRPLPQVNLQGLPQIVGLALGAPEFQRR